jgi:hypothetical protein
MEGVNEDDIHKLISSDEIIGASASGRDLAGLQLTLVIQKTQTHGLRMAKVAAFAFQNVRSSLRLLRTQIEF